MFALATAVELATCSHHGYSTEHSKWAVVARSHYMLYDAVAKWFCMVCKFHVASMRPSRSEQIGWLYLTPQNVSGSHMT